MVKPLDKIIICKIVTLRDVGLSWGQIANKLDRKSRSSAQSAYERFKRSMSFEAKKPTGRPEKLTEKTKKKLVRDVLKDPKTTLERIRVIYNSFATEDSISRATIRRVLKKYGIYSRVCAKKLAIKKPAKKNRLRWCRKMLREPSYYWQKVVFTDETRMKLTSDGIVRVFRRNGTRFGEKNTRFVTTNRKSLMFWGAIRYDGVKCLVLCPDRMNSRDYLKILEDYDEKMHYSGCVFQQDNAPIHKAAIIKEFFAARQWDVLEWPPYSPDLNPIENMWAIIKKRLQKQVVTWENLVEKVIQIWEEIDAETVKHLYNSFQGRLKKVKSNKGAIIGY